MIEGSLVFVVMIEGIVGVSYIENEYVIVGMHSEGILWGEYVTLGKLIV